jgi:histidinol dehydrogenase
MNGIPAKIAGVPEIVAVTPPGKTGLSPVIAFVLDMLDIKEVYQIGGAQAIGALAYGTRTIARVDKIVGPGNSFVATAKKMVYGDVDIDSVAGPSEIAILADGFANPEWVALDLLSQAEHGSGDETAVCITESKTMANHVADNLQKEIASSPVREVFEKLPSCAITIFIAKNRSESIQFINDLAPEHLQILTASYKRDVEKITNAAAIFIGGYTPVALGDYFIGTNHVLPTGSAARYASPLGVDSFLKRMSIVEITPDGLKLAQPHVSRFARAEGFVHHALSVERRVNTYR